MTTLPDRLLAFRDAAESTNDDEGNDGRATYVPVSLQTFRQTIEEAAAALSGGEADGYTSFGEFRWACDCDERMRATWTPVWTSPTPQPGDGVVVPREQLDFLRELFEDINRDDDGDHYMNRSAEGLDAIEALLAAAPQAQGEG